MAQMRDDARRPVGVEGNELLTSTVGALLAILLLAEGVTLLHLDGLLGAHMFIGLMLIPPMLVKLGSTGYRFVRYYTGAPAYREKGPPVLALRLLAPVLVAATVTIFASGLWLLALGHHSDLVLTLHKVAFIVWGGVFAVHVLAHLPRVVRALRGPALRSSGTRALLVASSLGIGIALALTLLSLIQAWRGHRG